MKSQVYWLLEILLLLLLTEVVKRNNIYPVTFYIRRWTLPLVIFQLIVLDSGLESFTAQEWDYKKPLLDWGLWMVSVGSLEHYCTLHQQHYHPLLIP